MQRHASKHIDMSMYEQERDLYVGKASRAPYAPQIKYVPSRMYASLSAYLLLKSREA